MRLRFSLFTRILLWFFLNLLVLGGVLLVFFNLQFRLRPDAPIVGTGVQQIENIARMMVVEMYGQSRTERDAIIHRYEDQHQVEFLLYENLGEKLAGGTTEAPPEVMAFVNRQPPPIEPGRVSDRPPIRGAVFTLKTNNPTRYWMGVRLPFFDKDREMSRRATMLVSSDSITAHGLFFDPKPWLIAVAVVLTLSFLLWFPFVRNLTRTIQQLTKATEQIAEEHFDVRVNEQRSDELGRLGKAINHLAERLSGFVGGQKRFLGDISHELNSPLGRMQMALSILEELVEPSQRAYVADAQEEVQLMAGLVSELLAYAKAGMKTSEVKLESVQLLPLVEQVLRREALEGVEFVVKVAEQLTVMAHAELLERALSNVIRNAARYAGGAGAIEITANASDHSVALSVRDHGIGVPEEALSQLFDPFFRLEADRARNTGGAGLGLAIVKSCVEACHGTITAKNCQPSGLQLTITLQEATKI